MNYNYNFNKLTSKNNDMTCGTYIVVIILAIAIAFGLSCLYAWIGMLLWNWVMPIIWASAPIVGFWPMWGLIELCSILFKAKMSVNTNKD